MWWTFSSDVTVIFHVFSHKTEAATAKTIARRRPLPPHPKPPPRLRRVFVGVENFGFRPLAMHARSTPEAAASAVASWLVPDAVGSDEPGSGSQPPPPVQCYRSPELHQC